MCLNSIVVVTGQFFAALSLHSANQTYMMQHSSIFFKGTKILTWGNILLRVRPETSKLHSTVMKLHKVYHTIQVHVFFFQSNDIGSITILSDSMDDARQKIINGNSLPSCRLVSILAKSPTEVNNFSFWLKS